MTARAVLLIASCALAACEPPKKETKKEEPAPTAGTPVATPGAAPAAPAAPLPGLAADPGGATGAPRFGVAFGGLATDAPRDVAVDGDGNVAVAGYFEGEATFGALGARTPAGKSDAFVARLAASGAPSWVQTFGAARDDVANGVAIDGKGNVAVTGNFLDTLTLGQGTAKAAGSDDIYVARFSPDGTPDWVWTAGGIESDGGNTIAAHPQGGWVVAGSFMGKAELGPHTFKSLGGPDAFLARLADSGEVMWALQLGGTYADTIVRVVTDPAGSIYVLGQFADKANFGGEILQAAGNAGVDVAIAKYDPSGKHLWSTRFGNPLDDAAHGLAVDPAGNVVVTGSFEKTITIGQDTFTATGESDVYVARFTTDGALQWAKAWGSTREDIGHGVAMDASGNAFVTGWFQETIDVGAPEALTSKGNKDVLLLKLDPAGRTLWARGFGDRDHDQSRGIAVDGKGRPVVAGVFRFTLDLVTPALESARAPNDKAPRTDAFVIGFDR
jgi:hypothetical protein